MHFIGFTLPLLLACLTMGSAKNSQHSLSLFGQIVVSRVKYPEIFSQTYNTIDELSKAERKAAKVFNEVIGTTVDPSLNERAKNEVLRIIQENDQKDQVGLLANVYTRAVYRTLNFLHKVNLLNIDPIATNYANQLNAAYESATDHSFRGTYPALVGATANLFKSEGVTSQEDVNQYLKFLIEELLKY